MKTRTSVLVLMMTMCPLVGRAQVCTDFDDDMNIIEYDCSRSLADVKREMDAAKTKAAAEAAAKAKAEADEKARIAAEKAKAAAEEKARIAAEKARIAAEKAAKEKAETEKKVQQCKLSGTGHALLGETCMDTKYFVAAGWMTENMNDDFSPSGFGAEIGARLDPLKNNWYYTFSILGQMADDEASFQKPTANGTTQILPYDLSLQSVYLTAGVGYKFWRIFDVYGKIAPGFMSMKLKSTLDNVNASEQKFGAAGIVGLNTRLYKWLHLYGEAQLSVNHPTAEVRFVQGNEYGIPYQSKQSLEWGTILSMRGGVKLVF